MNYYLLMLLTTIFILGACDKDDADGYEYAEPCQHELTEEQSAAIKKTDEERETARQKAFAEEAAKQNLKLLTPVENPGAIDYEKHKPFSFTKNEKFNFYETEPGSKKYLAWFTAGIWVYAAAGNKIFGFIQKPQLTKHIINRCGCDTYYSDSIAPSASMFLFPESVEPSVEPDPIPIAYSAESYEINWISKKGEACATYEN